VSSFLRLSENDVLSAAILLGAPSFVRPSRAKGAKAVGLRYERKVLTFFAEKHAHFVASPWFRYTLRAFPGRVNYAQPDGLFIDPGAGLVIIVEVKYAHTADAYFQLVDKYVPIIKCFLRGGDWRIAVVEVVHWYDASTAFPVRLQLLEDPLFARPNAFGVHILRPPS